MSPAPARTSTVLLVDDQPPVRRSLRLVLECEGFRVLEAQGGKEALVLVGRERPDLVVLDLLMPGMSGFDVLEVLRAGEAGRSIPVLVLSALGDRSDVVRAVQLGAQDYLVKASFQREAFVERVRRTLRAPVASRAASSPSRPAAAPAPAPAAAALPGAPGASGGEGARDRILRAVDQAEDVAALPPNAMELLQLIHGDAASAGDLASVIIRDQALTARVIRVANSSYYGGKRRRVVDVHSAVVTVGVRSLAHIAAGLSIMDRFASAQSAGLDVVSFFEHSIGCGVIARGLAASVGHPSPDEVFVYGMLHDIGKAFLAQTIPLDYARAVARATEEGRPLREVEREVLGIDHCAVGRRLARRWGLPETIAEVAFHHNDPWERVAVAKVQDPRGLGVAWLANTLTKALAIGHGGDSTLDEVGETVWEGLGLGGARALEVVNASREEVHVLRAFLVAGTALGQPPVPAGRVVLVELEAGAFPWIAASLHARGYRVESCGGDELRRRAVELGAEAVVLEVSGEDAERQLSRVRALRLGADTRRVEVVLVCREGYVPPPDAIPAELRPGVRVAGFPLAVDRLLAEA
ncbi:MAG: HDOD domain-containing protein [Planctomycetes bacterium]|nr:HDOD domain-containing protein [Planctomycetota bacterium]